MVAVKVVAGGESLGRLSKAASHCRSGARWCGWESGACGPSFHMALPCGSLPLPSTVLTGTQTACGEPAASRLSPDPGGGGRLSMTQPWKYRYPSLTSQWSKASHTQREGLKAGQPGGHAPWRPGRLGASLLQPWLLEEGQVHLPAAPTAQKTDGGLRQRPGSAPNQEEQRLGEPTCSLSPVVFTGDEASIP